MKRGGIMLPFRLEEMSVEDKLQAMEILWDDLCRNEQDIPSPPWHGELLQSRADALSRGEDQVEDWEEAKQRIRGEIL